MKTCASFYDGTMTDEDLDIMLATETQDGLMSKEDKIKLNSMSDGGSIESISASKVTQDTDHRFVTDIEKSTWNAKADKTAASSNTAGLMSVADKTKLDGIEEGANKYTHPESHAATMITEDETHRFVTDAEKEKWNTLPANKEAIGLGNVTNDAQVKRTEMGVANGVATLDKDGLVPSSQLPGFVDDVIEVENYASLPEIGEDGKIYVDIETNKTYRWSGSSYVEIPTSVALGETASTAYAGDKGKAVTDEVNKIKEGTTVVPKAQDATTVNNHTVETNVPEDAKFTDTVYEHPANHAATMITEDETHRFVTDTEKSTWNAKADAVKAEASVKDGLMSKEDKSKLDSIEDNANNYTHPEKHDASVITETSEKKFVSDAQISKWDAKADATVVSGEANGLMLSTDKTKLDGIAANANNYVHPDSHEATMITEDATHRFVTDEEKSTWTAKAPMDKAEADTKDGLMSKEDKTKLDGIEAQANKYEHPANHPATVITEDSDHRFVTDTEKSTWNNKADKTEVSSDAAGLMSVADKKKLDAIEANANNYVHPENHEATIITEDSDHRFVTDTEKSTWNNKADKTEATGELAGLMSAVDKAKLDGLIGVPVNFSMETESLNPNVINVTYGEGKELKLQMYLPQEQIDGKSCFITDELASFYSDLGGHPASYDMKEWDEDENHVEDLTAENGPYLVLVAMNVKTKPEPSVNTFEYVTSLKSLFEGYVKVTDKVEAGKDGLMSKEDKTKLDGIEEGANKYTHPENHPATVITEDETHRFVTDTEKSTWNAKANNTKVTTEADGLMSKEDKKKLDSINTIQLLTNQAVTKDGTVELPQDITKFKLAYLDDKEFCSAPVYITSTLKIYTFKTQKFDYEKNEFVEKIFCFEVVTGTQLKYKGGLKITTKQWDNTTEAIDSANINLLASII